MSCFAMYIFLPKCVLRFRRRVSVTCAALHCFLARLSLLLTCKVLFKCGSISQQPRRAGEAVSMGTNVVSCPGSSYPIPGPVLAICLEVQNLRVGIVTLFLVTNFLLGKHLFILPGPFYLFHAPEGSRTSRSLTSVTNDTI